MPGIYRHYKGNYYLVLGTAAHSETEERLVVYVALSQSPGPHLWVRPAAMFCENVPTRAGEVPRFQYVGQEIPKG